MTADEICAFFPGLAGTVYLNSATMGVGCAAAQTALAGVVDEWTRGRFDWTAAERLGEECRAMFAAMIGAGRDDIAIIPAVSTAAGLIAANMPAARSGENVIVAGHEFSSNYFSWLLLKERGYDVRTLTAPDGELTPERFAARADAGTRLIALSAVQSSDGYRADLKAIGGIARQAGARLFVDASQAAGAVPIDVVRDGIDYLVAVSYKFLCGPRGIGYLYVRKPILDELKPMSAGWKAARKPLESFYGPAMELSPTASRLDTSLVWFAAVGEEATRRVFEQIGLPTIYERSARLAQRLHDAIAERLPGVRRFPPDNRSQIVSVPIPDAASAMQRLKDAGVVASLRAGRVRLSTHFYNREDEIDNAVALLGGA